MAASRTRFFLWLRRLLAPVIRPVLEHTPPLRWCARRILASRQSAEVKIGGFVFAVDPGDFGVGLEISSTGEYEDAVRAACLSDLEPGMTFLDIGAHVGLYTVPAAKVVGETGRVIAVEPDPHNRSLLMSNLSSNDISNAMVAAVAIADEPGTLTLHRSAFNTGDHQLFHGGRGRRGVDVEVSTVDRLLEEYGGRADVIKMDVQGAESKALMGMCDTLATSPATVLYTEFTPWMLREAGDDPAAFLEAIVATGRSLEVLDDSGGGHRMMSPMEVMDRCPRKHYLNLRCAPRR